MIAAVQKEFYGQQEVMVDYQVSTVYSYEDIIEYGLT